MSYGFEDVARHVYKKTSLKDVRVDLYFQPSELDSDIIARIDNFFKLRFGLGDDNISDSLKIGVAIKSIDGLVNFKFSDSSACIKIKYPLYKCFDEISKRIEYLTDYLAILDVKIISRILISKFNEVGFEVEDEETVGDAMRLFFSESLLRKSDVSLSEISKQAKNLSRWERRYQVDDDQSDSSMVIVYGFSMNEENSQRGKLTLRSTIVSDGMEFDVSDIDQELDKYNHILDNAFHWCVTKRFVKKMEEE